MPEDKLDDLDLIAKLDPLHVFDLTLALPAQCAEALRIGESFEHSTLKGTFSNIVLAGMGGSAAGGDFLQAIFRASGTIPFHVVRAYDLPAWMSPSTLVIASSYSGNTVETLACYEQARRAGARLIALSGGGRLAELAERDRIPLIRVPAGQPPRTALAYLMLPLLVFSKRATLVHETALEGLESFLRNLAQRWGPQHEAKHNAAKQFARRLAGTIPVVYGLGQWQATVASRWKAQLNENSKMAAFWNAFPELTHNEIMGWTRLSTPDPWLFVVLQDGSEPAAMNERANFLASTVGEGRVLRVTADGDTLVQKMFSLSYFGDWLSLYLAVLNDVDPGDIKLMEGLKERLSSVNS